MSNNALIKSLANQCAISGMVRGLVIQLIGRHPERQSDAPPTPFVEGRAVNGLLLSHAPIGTRPVIELQDGTSREFSNGQTTRRLLIALRVGCDH
ncbi:MAG: hypothetical protein ACI915_005146 [Gammaproteobacteria bacterium]|jgi:hypothetical protein